MLPKIWGSVNTPTQDIVVALSHPRPALRHAAAAGPKVASRGVGPGVEHPAPRMQARSPPQLAVFHELPAPPARPPRQRRADGKREVILRGARGSPVGEVDQRRRPRKIQPVPVGVPARAPPARPLPAPLTPFRLSCPFSAHAFTVPHPPRPCDGLPTRESHSRQPAGVACQGRRLASRCSPEGGTPRQHTGRRQKPATPRAASAVPPAPGCSPSAAPRRTFPMSPSARARAPASLSPSR